MSSSFNTIILSENSKKFKSTISNNAPQLAIEGEKVNVTLHQSYLNATAIEFANLSNKNILEIPCPFESTFNSSYTECIIEHIYAPNKTFTIEDEWLAGEVFSYQRLAGSFKIYTEVILYNLSVQLFRHADPWRDMRLRLFNSTWNGTTNVPNSPIKTLVTHDTSPEFLEGWYTFSFNSENKYNFLDPQKTSNNTFYIELYDSGDEDVFWLYMRDNWDGSDDMNCFYYNGAWVPINVLGSSIDFTMKLELAPLNNSLSPSQIDLEVNDINVNNETGNSGSWISTQEFSDASGVLEFELSANYWDISCDITKIQVNYTKTDIKATSNYEIPEKNLILWNATINENIDYFNPKIDNYNYIIFTVPSNWTDIRVFNGSVEKPINYSSPEVQGYREIIVFSAGNGDNWYITAVIDNRIPRTNGGEIPFSNYYLLITILMVFTIRYLTKKKINLHKNYCKR